MSNSPTCEELDDAAAACTRFGRGCATALVSRALCRRLSCGRRCDDDVTPQIDPHESLYSSTLSSYVVGLDGVKGRKKHHTSLLHHGEAARVAHWPDLPCSCTTGADRLRGDLAKQ